MSIKSAVLLLDLQEAMFNDTFHPVFLEERLIQNINLLRAKAYEANMPVVYMKHTINACSPLSQGNRGWEILTDLAPRDTDMVFRKYTPNAFHETELIEFLQKENINRIYVAGLQTEFCVDTTVRAGFFLGYEMILVEDAHSTYDSEFMDAEAIINHHNDTLSHWFASLKGTKQIVL